MKALYTTAPGVYGLTDRPTPNPALDECLVRVAKAGICHTDVIIRHGAPHTRYPVIPGHEFSGVVEEVGVAAKDISRGDRVAVHTVLSCGVCNGCRLGDNLACENLDELGSKRDGGFAEYCAVPARCLYKLPDNVSLEEAALLEPLANAVCLVRQSGAKPGDRVVVIGPGPIGLMAVGVVKLLNPDVLAIVGTRDERLALGERFGATHVVNIAKDGGEGRLRAILSGKGADAVMECAGAPSALQLALSIVGWRGCIAQEGSFPQHASFAFEPYAFQARAATYRGVNGWETRDFTRGLDLIARGRIDVKPLISHTLPLTDWERAFELVTARKNESMKVLLVP